MEGNVEFAELIELALSEGCGIEPTEFIASLEPEVAARAAYWFGLAPESDEGIALKAGHIEMGELLNALTEDQAIKQAQIATELLDPRDVVLIEKLGEQLIAAASECLPPGVKDIAQKWLALSLEEQKVALLEVYELLRKAWKRSKNIGNTLPKGEGPSWHIETKEGEPEVVYFTPDVEKLIADLERRDMAEQAQLARLALDYAHSEVGIDVDDPVDVAKGNAIIANYAMDMHNLEATFGWFKGISGEDDYSAEDVLPKQYGVIGESAKTPNCLGMSIALLGFAKLIGAPAMLASQVNWATDEIVAMKLATFGAIKELFSELGGEQTPYFAWLERELRFLEQANRRVMDQHYGIALRLKDGSWWHLDPYQRSCAEFGISWELPWHYELLQKYSKVLPGLCMIADDGADLQHWKQGWADVLSDAAAAALPLMQAIFELPHDQFELELFDQDGEDALVWNAESHWVADLLEYSVLMDPYFDGLMLRLREKYGETDAPDFLREIDERYVRIRCSLLDYDWEKYPESGQSEVLEALTDLFIDDPDYHDEQILKAVTLWLRQKVLTFSDEVTKEKLPRIDPVLELGLPTYNVALAVISHLRSWTDCGLPGRLLLEYSSSQMYWHEAVDLSSGYDCSEAEVPEVLRAEAMVRSLPYLHRACARKLDYLAQIRAERGQSGSQENPRRTGGRDREASIRGHVSRRDLQNAG